MKRAVGIVRNKTHLLSEMRKGSRQSPFLPPASKGSRFSKQSLGHQEMQLVEMGEMGETGAAMRKPFIEDLSTVSTIEEPKPQWTVYYEQCQVLLHGVEDLRKEMLTNQNKRLTCVKVSQEKGYELKIYDCAKEATKRIKKCQSILEIIRQEGRNQTSANSKVCSTVTLRLANDIQETTRQLRLQQKSFVQQRKQFEVTDKPDFLELAVDEAFSMGNGIDELIEDEAMRDLEERNQEIRNIVESIYQLSSIYRQLGQLVVLQGSLLDRIDQNIEVSTIAVAKGLRHLQKANKHQKKGSRCSCMATLILMVLNFIVLIILCKKWF